MTSLGRFLLGQFQRQLKLAFSRPGEILNPIWFFMMVVALFPLGLGPRPEQLAPLAPGILWVVALLSQLTVSHRLFASDYEDGSLEQLVLSDHPLALSALAQVLAHWVVSGVTLALVSPLFAVVLALPGEAITTLVASLLIGTLGLSLVGAIGAALTVGIRRGALLLSLLIIPLYVPVLIFGTSAVLEASRGDDGSAWLALMGAWAIAGLILAPPAISAGLKISLDA